MTTVGHIASGLFQDLSIGRYCRSIRLSPLDHMAFWMLHWSDYVHSLVIITTATTARSMRYVHVPPLHPQLSSHRELVLSHMSGVNSVPPSLKLVRTPVADAKTNARPLLFHSPWHAFLTCSPHVSSPTRVWIVLATLDCSRGSIRSFAITSTVVVHTTHGHGRSKDCTFVGNL